VEVELPDLTLFSCAAVRLTVVDLVCCEFVVTPADLLESTEVAAGSETAELLLFWVVLLPDEIYESLLDDPPEVAMEFHLEDELLCLSRLP
jgi:hypothetical protein